MGVLYYSSITGKCSNMILPRYRSVSTVKVTTKKVVAYLNALTRWGNISRVSR